MWNYNECVTNEGHINKSNSIINSKGINNYYGIILKFHFYIIWKWKLLEVLLHFMSKRYT